MPLSKYFRLILLTFSIVYPSDLGANSKISYWNSQRKGTNIFNKEVSGAPFKAAAEAGIFLIRLAPDKWIKSEEGDISQGNKLSSTHDFLIGNADNFTHLDKSDLKKLVSILDQAHKYQVKIVLTMLSLPGSRWKQLNKGKDDLRLWKNEKYLLQAVRFWSELAEALKNHPAIVGYNILNEPHPEKIYGCDNPWEQNWPQCEARMLKESINLNRFNKLIVHAIRAVDKTTPIIIDTGLYSDPRTFTFLKPLKDDKVIYAFHVYEPYEYTCKRLNKGQFSYPGYITVSPQKKKIYWDKNQLLNYMSPVMAWQKKYNIPSQRILVAEFGGNRMIPGLKTYFKDLISIFNEQGWHSCFYAFREDTWEGMDYELGSKPLKMSYWQDLEKGKKPKLNRYDSEIYMILKQDITKGIFTDKN